MKLIIIIVIAVAVASALFAEWAAIREDLARARQRRRSQPQT